MDIGYGNHILLKKQWIKDSELFLNKENLLHLPKKNFNMFLTFSKSGNS
jgi:hypothetical protein